MSDEWGWVEVNWVRRVEVGLMSEIGIRLDGIHKVNNQI